MRKMVLFFLSVSLFLSGCGTTAKFVYPSKSENLIQLYKEPKYSLKVAVVPFEEKRSDYNSYSAFFLYLIPLVPYGTITYERPDTARMFNTVMEFEFNVMEDLAKAVATSLRRSGLFEDVFFTYGGEKSNADLIITGDVLSTLYIGKVYSYCLSVVGPALSIFGLPSGSCYNKLKLKLYLNKHKSKDSLWEYEFDKEITTIHGLYYKWGHDVKEYASLMEKGMNEAIKNLDSRLQILYSKDSSKVNPQSKRILPDVEDKTVKEKETKEIVEEKKKSKQNFSF